MTTKTDTIVAVRFAGESVVFRLERDPPLNIEILESRLGRSLFTVFRGIAEGNWTTTDFAKILSAAHTGSPHRLIGGESALVRSALSKSPPGLYAPLVAKVVEAFLFGLPVEEASFTDEQETVAA